MNEKRLLRYRPDMMNEKIIHTPDKKRIKEEIESGVEVIGARLLDHENLKIK